MQSRGDSRNKKDSIGLELRLDARAIDNQVRGTGRNDVDTFIHLHRMKTTMTIYRHRVLMIRLASDVLNFLFYLSE